MKTSIVTLLITFCFYLSVYAQAPQDKATELKEQALSSLKQKDYIKARYLFKKAYEAFAVRENYPQAIECGIQANAYMSEKTSTKKVSNYAVIWNNSSGQANRSKTKSFMTYAFPSARNGCRCTFH